MENVDNISLEMLFSVEQEIPTKPGINTVQVFRARILREEGLENKAALQCLITSATF